MWFFLRRRIVRLVVVVIGFRLARLALLAIAHRIELRHRRATATSRALVWIGETLPRVRRPRRGHALVPSYRA